MTKRIKLTMLISCDPNTFTGKNMDPGKMADLAKEDIECNVGIHVDAMTSDWARKPFDPAFVAMFGDAGKTKGAKI